jgi:WD40 repeat protein
MQSPDMPGVVIAFGTDCLAVGPVGISKPEIPVRIWNAEHGIELAAIPPFPGGVGAMVSIAARFLLLGTYDGLIWHLDVSQGNRNFFLKGHERGVISLAVLSDNRIASGSLDKSIRIWDLTTQAVVQVLQGHEAEVTGLALLSSGALASVSADHTVKLWNVETGRMAENLQLDTGLSSIAVIQDRAATTLVVGDVNGVVHFLLLEGGHGRRTVTDVLPG